MRTENEIREYLKDKQIGYAELRELVKFLVGADMIDLAMELMKEKSPNAFVVESFISWLKEGDAEEEEEEDIPDCPLILLSTRELHDNLRRFKKKIADLNSQEELSEFDLAFKDALITGIQEVKDELNRRHRNGRKRKS